ncbi:MAG: hypothetical protein KF723_22455 [Rhizobiaceae bacterium]|nr:hypothetical protein [Rhizobiaceae bacterium]
MTTGARILAALHDLADEDGVVPSMPVTEIARLCGVTPAVLHPQLWELARFGSLEKLDRRAPDKCTSRYRITGKPAGRDGSGETSKDIARREFVARDEINRRLKERYGIEVFVYQRDRYSEAISLPRVRALEGPAP